MQTIGNHCGYKRIEVQYPAIGEDNRLLREIRIIIIIKANEKIFLFSENICVHINICDRRTDV